MEGEECYTFGPLTVALFDRHSQLSILNNEGVRQPFNTLAYREEVSLLKY